MFIFVFDVEKSNSKAVNAIKRGAESIIFIIPNNEVSISTLIKNLELIFIQRSKQTFQSFTLHAVGK